ncbi:MAG TPA: sigma-70 family RNA polymerase sigma factor [Balneolaceae bacterium]|nr:sigma-70 family RNA polymerase sigma factor [Balneolaceae bacterium]|tara:strand:- start:99867 stop:100412 length:546 start_codon:yes stop_codon:yes gene_type:complete
MDYSEFVAAVEKNDRVVLARLTPIIISVLIKYLKVRLHAGHEDAQDCAQNALLGTIEQIRAGQVENPDTIIYYLFTSARNEFITLLRKHKEESYEEVPDSYKQDGDQLKNLLEEERQVVLEKCMNELRPDYKEYISYWFRHAGDEAAAVAKHFKISVNNAWTKKHRIIKMLKECCRKKLTI